MTVGEEEMASDLRKLSGADEQWRKWREGKKGRLRVRERVALDNLGMWFDTNG